MRAGYSEIKTQIQQASKLYEQGKDHCAHAHYTAASLKFHEASKLQEICLGKFHQDTIKSYWRCGKTACMASKTDKTNKLKALLSFQRASRMAETSFDASVNKALWDDFEASWGRSFKDIDALSKLKDLLVLEQKADACVKQTQYAEAAAIFSQWLDIQESFMVDGGSQSKKNVYSLDNADIRCKLAGCFIHLGNYSQAERELQRAHSTFVQAFGEDCHPATLGATATMQMVRERQRLKTQQQPRRQQVVELTA